MSGKTTIQETLRKKSFEFLRSIQNFILNRLRKKETINIQELPNEMIAKILSYVTNHRPIRLTCRKFNEIYIDSNFFKLCFKTYFKGKNFAKLIDFGNFERIMKSDCRFDSLSIYVQHQRKSGAELERKSIVRLTKIVERFGKDIKKLKIQGFILPSNFIEILNLMPNLKEIDISRVENNRTIEIEGKLELTKLRKIKATNCSAEDLKFFDLLPSGVLQELHLENISKQNHLEPIELFPNQHNIRKMTVDNGLVDVFNWRQVKLKKIHIAANYLISNDAFKGIVTGQDEVEILSCNDINEFSFNLICDELKSLKTLSIFEATDLGVPNLSKLRRLKTLYINSFESLEINSFLTFTQNSSLETLTVNCQQCRLAELTLTQFSRTFPQLKDVKLNMKCSVNVLNVIIKNCPKLENLYLNIKSHQAGDIYTFEQGLAHKKLKNLEIYAKKCMPNDDFLKFIESCGDLEVFKTTFAINEHVMIDILTLQPNLKTFLVHSTYLVPRPKITHGIVKSIKEKGRKLEDFYYFPCIFDGITPEKVQEEFRDLRKKIYIFDL